MKLFHGSNMDVKSVDLSICRNFTDFGKGFYLTTNAEHAKARAESKARVYGNAPFVSEWEMNESSSLMSRMNVKRFAFADEEWAEFVYKSRELGIDNDYDIVVGPVADDNMRFLFRNVRIGQISMKELVEKMKYSESSIQYCFRTQRSLKVLARI